MGNLSFGFILAALGAASAAVVAAWSATARTEIAPRPAAVAPAALAEERSEPPPEDPVAPEHSAEVRELLYHLRFGSNKKRRLVALELARLGPDAASAVPELIEFLSHDKDWWGRVRYEMCLALAAIGEPALPALQELLRHENERARASAAQALGLMGPAAAPAIPALIEALRVGTDKDVGSVEAAGMALGLIGDAALPRLLAALHDDAISDLGVAYAFQALGKRGAPALAAALFEDDVRARAAWVLVNVGKNARGVVPVIARALAQGKLADPWPLLEALGAAGETPVEVVPVLSALLEKMPFEESDARLRERWVNTDFPDHGAEDINTLPIELLGAMGPSAAPCAPLLRSIMSTNHVEAGPVAAVALWRITGDAETTVAYLCHALERDRSLGRHYAADALAAMGEVASAAIPTLVDELQMDKLWRRGAAASALAHIGEAALPAIRAMLEEAPPGERCLEAWMIASAYGERARSLEAELSRHLSERELRFHAARDPEPPPTSEPPGDVAVLLKDERKRASAAQRLGAMGARALAEAPVLALHADDEQPHIRAAVLVALHRITGEERWLRIAHGDPTPSVRVEAIEALPGDEWASRLLIESLEDPVLPVRKSAVAALAGRPQARMPLLAIANDEGEDEYLRDAARAALQDDD